jgi:hypothetical protein
VIVAVRALLTALVLMVKVVLVEPAGTLTDAGTVAAALELVRVTLMPPEGAWLLSVTVPVTAVPPVTALVETVTLVRDGGMIVTCALTVVPPKDAEMVALAVLDTALAMTEKVTLLAPAGTVTLAGTVALLLELEIVTAAPPVPLGTVADNVSVAVASPPPSSVEGEITSDDGVSGMSVRVADSSKPL